MKKGMRNEIFHTDEELTTALAIVNENVIDNELCVFYLTLGQTSSSKDVRFVLYRLNLRCTSQHVNPFTFVSLLSDSLVEAAKKAKRLCGKNPIIIDFGRQNAIAAYTRWTPDIIRFGKNAGISLKEVDAKYLIWIAKGCPIYDPHTQTSCNMEFGGYAFIQNAQKIAIERNLGEMKDGRFYDNDYIKLLAERQVNAPLEDHYYAAGEKVSLTLEVVGIFGYDTDFGYVYVIKFKDSNNRAFTYKGSINLELQKGDAVTLKGAIKHGAYKGINCTFLQRVKLIEAVTSIIINFTTTL